jgi:hypothetical protein
VRYFCSYSVQDFVIINGLRLYAQVFARINAIRIIEDTQLAQELKVSKVQTFEVYIMGA